MQADLLILDGRHLLWRTSDSHKSLVAEVDDEVIPTGGMYGFLACALRIHEKFKGTTVVAWEGKTNFRLRLYPEYKKKHEKPDPERAEINSEMAEQERRLIQILKTMGVRQYRGDDCEADDVIGVLAQKAVDRKRHAIIYSGDSDLRQLVCEYVTCVSPTGRMDKVYDAAAVLEKHDVPPELISDLKALGGDTSDNIPGVVGIGPKTAAKLLNHYGGVSFVVAAAMRNDEDWPVAPRHLDAIRHTRKNLRIFQKLTKINSTRGVKYIAPKRDQKALLAELMTYKFRSFASPLELRGLMRLSGKK